ncbi:MAG: ABC transporter permease [Clostridia bacterium]|nr:ABC transporter permease [Clostridia bacterium]
MKRFIHKGYFAEVFRQLRVAGIVSSVILMLVNLTTFIQLVSATNYVGTASVFDIPSGQSLAAPMKVFVYVMGAVLTFNAFGWLNKRSASDYYHAIPVTRTQMYWSTILAILSWMAIGLAAYSVVHALIYLAFCAPFNYLLFLCVFVNMLIGALEVVGAAAIACAISGTRFVNFCAAIVILFAPRFMLTVLSGFVDLVSPDNTLIVNTISILFNPTYNIIATPYAGIIQLFGGSRISSIISYSNGWAMLYNFAYSCVLLVLGCVAFNKRRSEAAGIPTTNKLFQGVIRTAVGLPLLMVLVYLILEYDGVPSAISIVILVLLSFVGYCLYELISTKSMKKTLKAMPLYSICIGIAALYLFLPYLINKAERSIDVSEKNIKGYQVASESDDDFFAALAHIYLSGVDYSSVATKDIKFTDPESLKIIGDAYARSTKDYGKDDSNPMYDSNHTNLTVRIDRKHGRSITRQLEFTEEEYRKLSELREKNEEYKRVFYEFPKGRLYCYSNNIGFADSRKLLATFKEEYEKLSNEDRLSLSSDNDYDYGNLTMSIFGCLGAENFSCMYKINEKTPETHRMYLEIINEKNGQKGMEALNKIREWMEKGDEDRRFNIDIGTDYSMEYWMMHYTQNEVTDKLPKDTDPDYYKIVKIFCNAGLTNDVNRAKVITVNTYSIKSITEGSGSYTFALDISDSDMIDIENLLSSYYYFDDSIDWEFE